MQSSQIFFYFYECSFASPKSSTYVLKKKVCLLASPWYEQMFKKVKATDFIIHEKVKSKTEIKSTLLHKI
jgi:hypothetical protein